MINQSKPPVVIIPIKSLYKAKSRLISLFDDSLRQTLVLNLLKHTINTTREVISDIWVVGTDSLVEQVAKIHGADWNPDKGTNINQSVRTHFELAWSLGMAPLYLPGDLPYVQRRDIQLLLDSSQNMKNAVLTPAQRSGGTNAILMPDPSKFRFQLGTGSFRKHVSDAATLLLPFSINYSLGLTLDLDTSSDLQDFEGLTPGITHRLTTENYLSV
jgi:2-phospho-L-lactate guanylyltransferase|tara:strand:+ start:291 stop:935 length:645 start_codon:yes stop_codon:yes gene_type:complete